MALKNTQKMILNTPQQLNRLTHPAPSIRETVEDDLDQKMRSVLDDLGLNSHEKIKRYKALLQRYLTLIKQGQREQPRVTLSLE